MPYVRDPKQLYAHAVKNNYILFAAHSFGDLRSLKNMLDAAEEVDSPFIVQFMPYMKGITPNVSKFLDYFVNDFCADYKIPIIMNHDHISSVEESLAAIDAGFLSIMYDGSSLPFEENVANTKKIVDYAHKKNVWVEAELGHITGFEMGAAGGFVTQTTYTVPEQAAEFIAKTGCDSLAIAVGTSHGGIDNGGETLTLDYELLGKIREAVGPEYPLVLHGAAQMPKDLVSKVNEQGGKVPYLDMCSAETIEKTRNYGIAKTNMDVDNWVVVTAAVRKHLNENPENYFFHVYADAAMPDLKDYIKYKLTDVTKSAGFASKYYEDVK